MKLHLLGIFYSLHDPAYSQCAYTLKCLRFSKMMQAQGFEVVEYANEGSRSEAREKVIILNQTQFKHLTELYNREFPNERGNLGSSLCQAFEEKLIGEVSRRAEPYDIICHPFGVAHARLGDVLPGCYHVETGIGYLGTYFPYRIYESYAWWHYHQGRQNRAGNNYEWVIPNYYDLEEWEPCYEPGEYLLYFGRITADKGLAYVTEIARHTDREVLLCGGGDPQPFLDPAVKNLRAIPPISGKARSDLLRRAYCMLMPTLYTEPFGGSGVEGMLCGTPLLASDFGAFTETVLHGVTGFRCKTLGDWLYAIGRAGTLDRRVIAEYARKKYSLETCGRLYASVFQQIQDLRDKGWYTLTPSMAIPATQDWPQPPT
jgi:glycosyltransferase involved in cell wall biosynthesis